MSSRHAILLSSGRRGTFMTLTALAARADMRVYDQVLGPEFLDGATGVELVEHVFGRGGGHLPRTILPVAWFNARDRYPGFWEALRARRIRVVSLRRRNLLRCYVSLQLARTSGEWIAAAPQEAPSAVTIDPADVWHFVQHELETEQKALAFFSGHRVLEMHYEDMLDDYDFQQSRLQSFLGLVPQRLRPTSRKQSGLRLSALVRNYAELCEVWRTTPWSDWLRDDIEPAVETAGPQQRWGRLLTAEAESAEACERRIRAAREAGFVGLYPTNEFG
jgi:hypothetical protein